MYVVFLNQHLIKNGQHSKTLSSHKWFKTTHKKQLRWENVLKYSISEIHKNQKYSFEEIVFLKKKLGMALKQEIIVWKNSQNLGWAPHFLEGPGKKAKKCPNRVIACFEAIQYHIKIQKIYFIYCKRLGNKK